MANEHFKNIDEQLKKGIDPSSESVRTICTWFGASKRGVKITKKIQSNLKEYNLATEPNFEALTLNGCVKFIRANKKMDKQAHMKNNDSISRLESANNKPKSIKPESRLEDAVTQMIKYSYSQLPVMIGSRDVKGIISWESIGSKLAICTICADSDVKRVKDYMSDAVVVKYKDSIFGVINEIVNNECVLVQAEDNTICGIVTASDLSTQFKSLAEPFLLIGEIECNIRNLIHGKYDENDLRSAMDTSDGSRDVESVNDLTFGEYIRLIENKDNWSKLGLKIDRPTIINSMHEVREIRNGVMHFDPDGVSESDIDTLNRVLTLFRTINSLKHP